MRKLSKEEVVDILYGCVVLGTGGGGSIDEGLRIIEEIFELNKDIVLVDTEEVPDEAIIVTPYLLGALTYNEMEENFKRLPQTSDAPILMAVDRMEQHINSQIYGAIACETGGSNTAIPMYVAALKDGYVLDADIAGRAVPEVTNSTYYINGLPASPVSVANEFGEVSILENIYDDERSEEILRALAVASRNTIAAVDHAMPFKELKHAIIPGTLSKAMGLGKIFREVKASQGDVAEALAKEGKGAVVFKGTVRAYTWDTVDGFTVGDVILDNPEGDSVKIWFKNENLMSWKNGEVFVTLPDLICLIDTDTNTLIETPKFREGMKVSMVVYDGPEAFKTEKGLVAFGPKRYGYDMDYIPAAGRIFD